uniref:Uncharacterized protein n=1 Tax=Compsopogon caeruleus TaxID=31354 RepID=A0A6T6B0X6_9RHOD
MSHLYFFPLEAALFVKRDVIVCTIENDLVASALTGFAQQDLHEVTANPAATDSLINDDILDVSDKATPAKHLSLNQECCCAYEHTRGLAHDGHKVVGITVDLVEAAGKLLWRDLWCDRELTEQIK